MERQLSLEVMPIIIIDQIASYLSTEDIMACCATSTKMRDVFSDDLIWRRYCNVDRINYLKRSACWVEPVFEWENDRLSKLSPITEWKRNFMMQAHLFQNWRNGRFEKSELEYGPPNVVYSQSRIEFYENDFLFLHTYLINNNKLLDEIWDVVETPFLHSTFSSNIDQFDNLDSLVLYKIAKNKLVVGVYNLILVYDITLGSFSRIPLVNAFLFDKSEKCSKDVITHDENTFYRTTYFELVHQVEMTVSGNLFVGAVTNFKDFPCPAFHVWDIQKGQKIDEVNVPAGSNLAIDGLQFLSCDDEKNVVVKLRVLHDRHTYHCYGYDLSKMMFTSFLVKLNYCDFQVFKSKFLIGAAAERIFVYNYETSEKLLVRKCPQQILKKTINVVGEKLLFGTFENVVHVFDLATLDIINKVKLGFTLYSLRAICDKFVVINSVNSEVWEIGRTARKLFKFPVNGSFVAVNQHCTKLAIEKENKIIILHFW